MLNTKLDTLLAVAKFKNFTKAAKYLSLTQPAVSHHIDQLEEECNAVLFYRNKNEIKLTKEGEIAVAYAKKLKVLHNTMLQKISDEQKHISNFRIGITHTSENNKITDALAILAEQNRGTTITIITNPINILYDMLNDFELDIAILEGNRLQKDLNYFVLDTDCLVCVLSNDNPLAKKSIITIEDLKKENMILRLPTSDTRKLFENSLFGIHESIDDFNVLLEVENVATIKSLVRQNLGVSILPQSVCLSEVKKKKLKVLPIENLSMIREVNVVYNKESTCNEFLDEFVKIYRTLTVNQ